MRLNLFHFIAFSSIMATALIGCRQQNIDGPSSHWTIEADTYTATNVSVDTTDGFTLIANSGGFLSAGNTVEFFFPKKPVSDGSIAIGIDSAALKISAVVIGSSGKHYYFRNEVSSATRATYTLKEGKITLDIPTLPILGSYDTVSFSAHAVQP